MKSPKILGGLLCVVAVGGCDHGAHGDGHRHGAHVTGATAASAPSAGGAALTLNDGKKWAMDAHTRRKVGELEAAFRGADTSTRENLNALGTTLSKHLDELIAGCTMSGKAHDQLHVFLTDFIPAVQALSKAESLPAAKATASKIGAQLEKYRQHFE